MYRLSIISLTLVLVLFGGLNFSPFELGFSLSYRVLEPFQMNPSITPITYDMSMMTSQSGDRNLREGLQFQIKIMKVWATLSEQEMDFYLLRIPSILYFEQFAQNIKIEELRFGICHNLKTQVGEQVESYRFYHPAMSKDHEVFNQEISCQFS